MSRVLAPSLPVLIAASLLMAYDTSLPLPEKLLVTALALAGIVGGTLLRLVRERRARDLAPLPVLAVFGILAAVTPVAVVPELLAGASGVVLVAWLTDDPVRPANGLSRGSLVWAVPAIGVGVAWASASLLPSTAAPVGFAGGLLAAALVILAYLVRRPELFDREDPATV